MNRRHSILLAAKTLVPASVRRLVRSKFSLQQFDLARRIENNPYRDQRSVHFENSEFTLGIIEEVTQYHQYYIAACLELEISFKVLPLLHNNWIKLFQESGCDGYLVWPSSYPSTSKQVYDDRLFMLENDLGALMFPSWKECWLTEYKPRLRDWLVLNDIPHPETSVFYDQHSAFQFAANTEYPVVVKTATGGGASGVSIVENRSELYRTIRLAFRRGLRPRSYPPYDRQRGYILIQKYYPNVQEWRMVRIGNAYFGHRKGTGRGGMHSGSGTVGWEDPGDALLNLTREVTEKGGFESMDVDVFKTDDGRLLVNECQTVFGCTVATTQMKINGLPGHYRFQNDRWKFVEGDICQNHLCNLRIKRLLKKLKCRFGISNEHFA